MARPRGFVDLQRRFVLRDDNMDNEDLAASAAVAHLWGHGSAETWDTLIEKNQFSVILGEPGSGRTWEFQNQEARINAQPGGCAFFIELARLIRGDVTAALSEMERNRFERWLIGNETAVFLLDAVDEAKLARTSDFDEALGNFERSFTVGALKRSKILVSSRILEWDHQSDPARVSRALGLETASTTEGPAEESADPVKVYIIRPLDRHQIQLYAESKGTDDTADFLRQLEEKHCWEYAGRPYDVDSLLTYWKNHQTLDDLGMMLDELVNAQLVEKHKDHAKFANLSLARARAGAETLAATSVFCKNLNFGDNPALSPEMSLGKDWPYLQIQALLNRALFASPSYNLVRFQHRKTAEFLAAKWLLRHISDLSNKRLFELFFTRTRSKTIPISSREATAVWLCSLSNDARCLELRRLMLRLSPDAFFRNGDPSLLSGEFKALVIKAWVGRFSDHDVLREEIEASSVSRFSDPVVGEEIARHLNRETVPPRVKIALLRIARYARLKECVPSALNLVATDSNMLDLAGYSFWLIEKVGDQNDKQSLAERVPEIEMGSKSIVTSVLGSLYPNYIGLDELEDALRRGRRLFSDDSLELTWKLKDKLEKLEKVDIACDLGDLFLRMLTEKPHIEGLEISQDFKWLGEALYVIVRWLIEKGVPTTRSEELVATAILHLEDSWFRAESSCILETDNNKNFGELTLPFASLRQRVFWMAVRRRQFRNGSKCEAQQRLGFSSLIDLHFFANTSDLEWMLEDIQNRDQMVDRDIAFYLACHTWLTSKGSASVLWALLARSKSVRDRSQAIRSMVHARSFSKIRNYWHRNRTYGHLELRWWTRKARKVRNSLESQWQKFCDDFLLLRQKRALVQGEADVVLHQLCVRANRDMTRRVPVDFSRLKEIHGSTLRWFFFDIEKIVATGCKASWTRREVSLAPHPPNKNTSVAHSKGIELLVESGEDPFCDLTDASARYAAKMAVDESNHFPDWLDRLANSSPAAVRKVLLREIYKELRLLSDSGYAPILSRISRSPIAAEIVSPYLFGRLKRHDIRNPDVLDYSLSILMESGTLKPDEAFNMARSQVGRHPRNSRIFVIWFTLMIQTDVSRAISWFEHFHDTLKKTPGRYNPVVSCCSRLLRDGERFIEFERESQNQLETAVAWTEFVYRWVKKVDDLHRTGGWSPNDRDHAQQYRGTLFWRLREREEIECDAILSTLSTSAWLTDERDFILHTIEHRALFLGDRRPLTQNEFAEFANSLEEPVQSDRMLFDLVVRRLKEIQHDVEDAEESIRDEFQPKKKEKGLQSFLARKLRERNNNGYSSVKEAEIDGAERLDIKVLNDSIDRSIQIEIKFGDMSERTISSLQDDLENQLLGQYLRDNENRFGVFLVGFAGTGRNKWKCPDTGTMLSFAGVLDHLAIEAKRIIREKAPEKTLEVIGIDFRERKTR